MSQRLGLNVLILIRQNKAASILPIALKSSHSHTQLCIKRSTVENRTEYYVAETYIPLLIMATMTTIAVKIRFLLGS